MAPWVLIPLDQRHAVHGRRGKELEDVGPILGEHRLRGDS
jgi:hypothetical protein